ncbi:MFS transporter [Paenibacillus sp. TRM 82003]|nr:MFS transporter [Paenibacillus sp. TRM 82003]
MNFFSERTAYFRLKLFMFFMFGPIALFSPYLPLYLKDRGFSPSEIGLLLTVGPIVALFSNPFWGYVGDRLQNMKLVLLLLMSGTLVASQILFHVTPYWLLLVAMMLYYFFNTAIMPINNSQVFQTIENTPLRFGSFRLWGSLGFALIVWVSGPIVEFLGIEQLGWVYGFFMVLAIALGLLLHRPARKSSRKPGGRPPVTFRQSLGVLLQGRFALFLGASVLVFIPNSINGLYLSLFIEEVGGSASSIGWSWFLAAVLEVPLFFLLDRLSKPTAASMINLLMVATGIFAVRWLLMSFATEPIHLILIQLLHAISFGFYFYTAAQLVEYLTERSMRASGQTMYALVQGAVAAAIAGSLGGYLYEVIGPHTLYALGAGLTLAGLAVMALLRLTFRGEHADDGDAAREAAEGEG